ncbi:hypothetical protein [Microbulbifer halophilus]|uniref:Class I SAM-dependent methyltransferase n=1 Tax=Microbulbifer halophilus TaxID=453963 RepID=A0ABW5EIK1_9GAMM|nr:hypothetical protein [Microbulbifer halophilus]MCW8127956.1 hypothetical protein [Microbulbifer halophilus]
MSLIIGALPNSQWQRLSPLLNSLGWQLNSAEDPESWYQNRKSESKFSGDVYILFFTHPEVAASDAMREKEDPVTAIEIWSNSASKMLEFHKSNLECSILVDVAEALREPKKFFDKVVEKLDLVEVEDIPELKEEGDAPGLYKVLASQLVDQIPALNELREDFLRSCISLSSNGSPMSVFDVGKLYEEQLVQQKALQEKEMEVKALSEENEMALRQLFHLQESLEKMFLKQSQKGGVKKYQSQSRSRSKVSERTLSERLAAKIKRNRFLWKASAPARIVSRPFRRVLSRKVGLSVALARASKELSDIKPRYQTQEKKIAELEGERKSLGRELKGCQAELTELRKESKSLKECVERLENLLDHAARLNVAEREYVKGIESLLGRENDSLKEKIDSLQKNEKSLDLLESRLCNAINSGLVNNFLQIESYIAVQNYLIHGELAMDFHGWPISPDIASYLISRIEKNNYDLIVEFGSGTSTQLFAKAVQNNSLLCEKKARKAAAVETIDEGGSDHDVQKNASAEVRRVISFEHNEQYYDQTKKELERKGLDSLVYLACTPLIKYQYAQKSFNYYSCDGVLEQASQAVGTGARILVLVDGPPGNLGPLSRFPALPKLLSYFSNCTIDIVLDDFNRPEEKAVVAEWKRLLDERNIAYYEEKPKVEKGAICLSVIS